MVNLIGYLNRLFDLNLLCQFPENICFRITIESGKCWAFQNQKARFVSKLQLIYKSVVARRVC